MEKWRFENERMEKLNNEGNVLSECVECCRLLAAV